MSAKVRRIAHTIPSWLATPKYPAASADTSYAPYPYSKNASNSIKVTCFERFLPRPFRHSAKTKPLWPVSRRNRQNQLV